MWDVHTGFLQDACNMGYDITKKGVKIAWRKQAGRLDFNGEFGSTTRSLKLLE